MIDEKAPAYAQVVVLAQLGRAGGLFTYGLPLSLRGLVRPGMLVQVPFTSRQLPGIIWSLDADTELPHVRDVVRVLDDQPVLTPHQLRLARWITDYYAAPLSDVLGAMIPPGLGRRTVYILEPGDEQAGRRISPEQQQVLALVQERGSLPLDDAKDALPGIQVERLVTSLVSRKLLTKRAELAGPRVRERTVRVVQATPAGKAALLDDSAWKSERRRAVLEHILLHGPLPASEVSRSLRGASGHIRKLEEGGMVTVEERTERRDPLSRKRYAVSRPLPLSQAQGAAHDRIVEAISSRRSQIFLLHGVTGSGKTEVYLQAVARTIEGGRQAIVMVPEISLTPQAVERVASRFPGKIAVLHSKLSPGERVDEWQRIRSGEVQVVVGPRSALFAPLPCPGLIVVDEEHDPSYKQDSSPRYNARDAAAVLGRMTGATVVFGSATPDIGTYHAAKAGRIRLLELPDRPVWEDRSGSNGQAARAMPPVEIVDLRDELKSGNRSIFSEQLLAALNDTLARGEQALLFLNRRGSATVVMCRDCGYVARCPHCDIPLTYHASASRLICHRCDRRVISPRICPSCDGPRIRYLGIGTERVAEEVAQLFPQARVLRWDRDVTGGKEAHDELLQQFARHEADLLVGTQMIAKGLDFPLVTLVGVISADTGLHLPDFRAPERSFQLLTQVAGRAGRSTLPSRVIVQTYTPEHYAIQAAQQHDYHRFYDEEMTFRRTAGYPPFARLVRFVYSSEDNSSCKQSAENLAAILENAIRAEKLDGAEVIGPAPCFVARVKRQYFWQVIVRGTTSLQPLLDYAPPGWSIDVDPVDLL